MLIMCEVVSNECKTLPPPPSQLLSPKEKKEMGVGKGRSYSVQSRPFQKMQTVHRHAISWLFCFKHQLTFQIKSKGPQISWETLFGFFFFSLSLGDQTHDIQKDSSKRDGPCDFCHDLMTECLSELIMWDFPVLHFWEMGFS